MHLRDLIDYLNKDNAHWLEDDQFYLIVSELLGDAFFELSPESASESYEEALSIDGENLRLLSKLYEVSLRIGDKEKQKLYLAKLLKLEKRKSIQSKYADLLSQLLKESDFDESVAIAYKFWKSYKKNITLTENLVELLIIKKDFTLAIECLKSTIDHIQDSRLKIHIESLNLKITEIWLRHLKRHDIAETRLMQHLAELGRDYEAYKNMEKYFAELGDCEARAQLVLNKST